MLPPLPRDNLLEFCRKMLLIRHFEEALITLHNEGRFRGHYHVYIGQEATGVPALSLLAAEDYVFTTKDTAWQSRNRKSEYLAQRRKGAKVTGRGPSS